MPSTTSNIGPNQAGVTQPPIVQAIPPPQHPVIQDSRGISSYPPSSMTTSSLGSGSSDIPRNY